MAPVQGSGAAPWSDLPSELLGLVFLRLPTRADRAFFAAVCCPWRSAARECPLPPPSPVPWLLLPDGSATSFPRRETFQLPDGMRYHNSCGEWIQRLIEGISFPLQEGSFCMPYLLESHGTLLMICRKLSYTIEHAPGDFSIFVAGSSEFVLFEANPERHLWAEMRTLGNDQALFLGRGCSRAVHVSPDDLSRDCIFFLDDSTYWFWNWKKTTTSCELYDMKDGKIYSPLPMISWKSGKVPATWIFSQGETDKAANSRGGSTGNCGS